MIRELPPKPSPVYSMLITMLLDAADDAFDGADGADGSASSLFASLSSSTAAFTSSGASVTRVLVLPATGDGQRQHQLGLITGPAQTIKIEFLTWIANLS